jgi:hypothetical protein
MWRKILSILRYWLPLAIAVTGLCALVYLAVQQNIRQSANDPQIQIAEDAAVALEKGAEPTFQVQIDIAKSLAAYMIIFDEQGQPTSGNASLDGQLPKLPSGVFNYTRSHGQDRFTWQPKDDVRSAVVVAHYSGPKPGFVLVGRSMREIERRENRLALEVLALWVFTLFCTLVSIVIMQYLQRFLSKI